MNAYMLVLKHCVEICFMHEEDYAKLIRMNEYMLGLKHCSKTLMEKNVLEDWLLSLMSTLVMGFGPQD
jgi:hypothetical protein